MTGERILPGMGLTAFYDLGSGGWKNGIDGNLRVLSAVTQLNVISRVAVVPGVPTNGDMHILTSDNTIALYDDGAWYYVIPKAGWVAYSALDSDHFKYNGVAWILLSAFTTLVTTSDLTVGGNILVTGTVDGRDIAAEGTKLDLVTVTNPADLDAMQVTLASLGNSVVIKGDWDASIGSFPGGGVAVVGWSYQVSVAGTVNGVEFSVRDRIIALVDNASTSIFDPNWLKADYSDTVTSVAGKEGVVVIDTSDLTDINAPAPSDGDILAWDNATSKWVNGAPAVTGGNMDFVGDYDATTNTPDLDTTPSGITKGDTYSVSVAGTFFTIELEVGDMLLAEKDNPTVEADWTITNRNIDGTGGSGGNAGNGVWQGAKATLSADDVAVNYSTATAIPWDESEEAGEWWDVANSTRLTIPIGVAKIRITAQVGFTAGTVADIPLLYVSKNGVFLDPLPFSLGGMNASGNGYIDLVSGVLDVVATDYFELFFSTGGDVSVNLTASRSWFSIEDVESVGGTAVVAKYTRLGRSTLQAISTTAGAYVPVTWTVEDEDALNAFDLGTNPDRITPPEGLYDITTAASFAGVSTAGPKLLILRQYDSGGANIDQWIERGIVDPAVDQNPSGIVTVLGISVANGDYFRTLVSTQDTTYDLVASDALFTIREAVGGSETFPDKVGNAAKVLVVNSAEDGTEWVNQSGVGENLIINGAMRIAQRSASEVGLTTTAYHTLDRWELQINTAGTFTMAKVTSTLEGFASALRLTCTAADAALAVGDYVKLVTKLEGQDLQHLLKGTANAKDLSLSFLCQADDTKTFVAEIVDNDNGRHIAGTFTIGTSGIGQSDALTFAGDVTGALGDDENSSLELHIWLAAGATYTSGTLATVWATSVDANRAVGCSNLADAISNYFEITGVKLEVGSDATPYQHLKYGDELVRCQRYFYQIKGGGGAGSVWDEAYWGSGNGLASTDIRGQTTMPVPLRANPTKSSLNTAVLNGVTSILVNVSTVGYVKDATTLKVSFAPGSGGVVGAHYQFGFDAASAGYLKLDAEL